ncbi:uncharacterized protein LOC105255820 [Camponotus floridanus]|uniref:uncharacterized protein LOC105255820 n=1 Tax=Camponotus floridanus TaxID=104421 RepID=UPI00059DA056|nr:uncharacterized protein LOC105255820 [Camponotus floridanus]
MKTVYYLLLLFGVTLPWIAGLNLDKIIKTAQCQSACLRNFTTDDNCWNVGRSKNIQCEKCWQTCEFLGLFNNEQRLNYCNRNIYFNPKFRRVASFHFLSLLSKQFRAFRRSRASRQCSSCEIACTFYRTHGIDEGQYEPIKLPAPEKDEIIRMNKHDMAITMYKNLEGIWKMQQHYTENKKVEMSPGKWIIITNENGAIKHYSWEKWLPTLQSIYKKNGPLYQANITWMDWQDQLEKQRDEIILPGDKIFMELRNRKHKTIKPLYIVTWQEETGNGIMGNQVADSESAQISLLRGRYLVRIATNDGPGSYSILIDTDETITTKFLPLKQECYMTLIILSFILIPLSFLFIKSTWKRLKIKRQKIAMENNIKMIYPTEAEMKSNKLNTILCFKHESDQRDSDCSTNSYLNNINEYNKLWIEIDINANANMQNANVENVNVDAQDVNANIQDVTANTQNATTNVIQQT